MESKTAEEVNIVPKINWEKVNKEQYSSYATNSLLKKETELYAYNSDLKNTVNSINTKLRKLLLSYLLQRNTQLGAFNHNRVNNINTIVQIRIIKWHINVLFATWNYTFQFPSSFVVW